MDNPLGEKVSELKALLRQETDALRAEAAVTAAQQPAEVVETEETRMKDRSPAFVSFLENVQAKVGEIKNEETLQLIGTYEEKARNLFKSNVSLAVLPNSATDIGKILDASTAAAVRGSGPAWTGVLVDPSQWGEAITSPNIRNPPLNLQLVKQFMNAVIRNRDKQSLQLHDRDIVIYFDGFTPNNTSKVLASMQNSSGNVISKNVMTVYLSYDEDSLRARRQYVKANSTIFQQIEVMSLVTHEPFNDSMTYRSRTLFKGSSLGNKIGDVVMDAPGTLWSLTLKDFAPAMPAFVLIHVPLLYFLRHSFTKYQTRLSTHDTAKGLRRPIDL